MSSTTPQPRPEQPGPATPEATDSSQRQGSGTEGDVGKTNCFHQMLRLQMDLDYEQRRLGRNQRAAFLCEELQKLHEEPQPSDLGYSDDNV